MLKIVTKKSNEFAAAVQVFDDSDHYTKNIREIYISPNKNKFSYDFLD